MVCVYCGLETDRSESHATQQQCREALRLKVAVLAEEVGAYREAVLTVPDRIGSFYQLKLQELTTCRERLLQVNELLEAVAAAQRLGTRSAWERVLRAMETWAASPYSPTSSGGTDME